MTKSTKIIFILAGLCITLGIALFLAAFFIAGGTFGAFDKEDYTQTTSYMNLEGYTSIVYTGSSRKLVLRPSEDENLYCQYYESERETLDFDGKDGKTLNIKQKNNTIFQFYIEFDTEKHTVYLDIPSNISHITLKNASGDIEISTLSLSEGLVIDTASGDCRLTALKLGDLEVDTESGGIKVYKTEVQGEAKLEASGGSINISEVTMQAHAEIETSSGKIELQTTALKSADIETSSGAVLIKESKTENFYTCKTGSGNIQMNVKNHEKEDISEVMRETLVSIKTSSGNIKINK